MRRALAITAACYGRDHPDVAIPVNNLAGLLYDTDRRTEAEPLLTMLKWGLIELSVGFVSRRALMAAAFCRCAASAANSSGSSIYGL